VITGILLPLFIPMNPKDNNKGMEEKNLLSVDYGRPSQAVVLTNIFTNRI